MKPGRKSDQGGTGMVKGLALLDGDAGAPARDDSLWVGNVEIIPSRRLVRRDGDPLPLGSRAFDLLVALIERRHRVCTKRELMDLVWPHADVVESNLQVHVLSLRRLLGHDAIATVTGRGYRFTGPLRAGRGDDPAAGLALAATPGRHAPAQAAAPLRPWPGDPRARLVGRLTELDALQRWRVSSGLLTLTGPGGVGKSALAAALAHAHADAGGEVAWIDFAAIGPGRDPARHIAQTLGWQFAPDQDPADGLVPALAGRALLLVWDNAEAAAPELASLANRLGHMPSAGPRLLITSQWPLRFPGEQVRVIDPLPLPDDHGGPATGALALLIQEARAIDPDFMLDAATRPLAIELCRRLDGLPLAIRLAAARLPMGGLSGLLDGLSAHQDLASPPRRDPTLRHASLRAAYAWSHDLLDPTAQSVWRRLAVCRGGFDLPLATAVAMSAGCGPTAALDAVQDLVERSLLMRDPGEPPRYRLLDSARDDALRRLVDRGEEDDARRAHAAFVLGRLRPATDAYVSLPESAWLARYGSQIETLRDALAWAVRRAPRMAVELLSASARVYQVLGLFHEALPHTTAVLHAVDADTPPDVAAGYWVLRWNALQGVSREAAAACYPRYLDAARRSGDPVSLFLALMAGVALGPLTLAQRQAHTAEMRALIQDDWPLYLRSAHWLAEAIVARVAGDAALARGLMGQVADAACAEGKSRFAAHALSILVGWDLASDDHAAARDHAARAVTLQRTLGAWNLMLGLNALVQAQVLSGGLAEARETLREWVDISRRLGWRGFHLAADAMAVLQAEVGHWESAALMLGYADAAFARAGTPRDPPQARLRARAESLLHGKAPPPSWQSALRRGALLGPEAAAAWFVAARG